MSFILGNETKPPLQIKTYGMVFGGPDVVMLEDSEIPVSDFLAAVQFSLTNKDLRENDPRLWFLEMIKTMDTCEGYNGAKSQRLETTGEFIGPNSDETDVITFNEFTLSIEDFLFAGYYVLTNTDLYKNDPRLKFVKDINLSAKVVEGEKGKKRIQISPIE